MRSPLPAKARAARAAQAPLLDRLLDTEPALANEPGQDSSWTIQALRRAVHRDLEALLNTRRPWRSVPPSCPNLRTSPLGYGMPDFTAGAFNERSQRETFRLAVEEMVCRFEPRIAEVKVTITDDAPSLRPTLHLRIQAVLLVQPMPEPLRFDTVIDPTTSTLALNMTNGA
jgi:type VI secretion system protein ImpF